MKTLDEEIEKKRLDSTKEYLDALQGKYSKLNVIRVDLAYIKPYSDDITLDDANDDFNRMLNNRRSNSIFKNQVGYICKKEYTVDKGVHFHTVFFYNGQKVKNDVQKAIDIGNYWNDTITKNKGSFHNCNLDADKKYGEDNAVGMLDHRDDKKRKNLDKAISYLCKDEQNLEPVKSNSKDKAFVRSTISKKKSNKGRLRGSDKNS